MAPPGPQVRAEPRGSLDWLRATRTVHPARRAAWGAVSPPASGEAVTVVCVTNRPARLGDVVDNFTRQVQVDHRLVVVTNSDDFDGPAVAAALAAVPGAEVLAAGAGPTLGECLNLALEHCTTRFVAKVDDDDWYGPHYLRDAILVHRFADAAVVGKHSYFVHLGAEDRTVLRFPGRELEVTRYVAGGTLVLDRERLGAVRFPRRDVGEDQGLLEACLRAGQAVYAGDRFNYLQSRHAGNTWRAAESTFTRGAVEMGPGRTIAEVEV